MGIVYCAKNKINGKYYIGKTKYSLEKRKRGHLSRARTGKSNSYFHRAISKYGEDAFEWKIIDECEDEKVLNQLERLYISKYESNDSFWGYNLTIGGDGKSGFVVSEETKRKMSDASKGEKHPLYGKSPSKNTRKLVSKSNAGGSFGFKGGYYKYKDQNPWTKVWMTHISYKGKRKFLGYFHDPLTCQIVYDFVWHEIYDNI